MGEKGVKSDFSAERAGVQTQAQQGGEFCCESCCRVCPCSPAYPHIVVDHTSSSCLFIKISPGVHSRHCCDKLLCMVCRLNILVILLLAACVVACMDHAAPSSETTLIKTEELWKAHSPHVGIFMGIQRSTAH